MTKLPGGGGHSRAAYVVSVLTFLTLVSWMSVRAYDNMIGQIYYGSLNGFFASAFRVGARGAGAGEKTRAAVFYSNATAANSQSPDQYGSRVVAWRRTLAELGVANDVIDDKGLLDGSLRSYNVLVVPLATHLSDAQAGAIKDFVAQDGHGLILSGAAGSYRETGQWREISLAAEIVGADDIKEAASSGSLVTTTLNGRNALTANIPPGLRLDVRTFDRPVSLRVLEPRTESDGEWTASPGAKAAAGGARTSLAAGSYRGGRFVWMGFTLDSAVEPFGLKVREILAGNMLAYASFRPIFAKEAWPDGKQAAVAVAIEADDLDAAAAAAPLFTTRKTPCTFFCSPETAPKSSAAFKSLAAEPLFELGLSGDGAPAGRPAALLNRRQALEALSGRPVAGFSAPPAALEDASLRRGLLDAGYAYAAGGAPAGSPPVLIQARRPRLLSIGRSIKTLIGLPPASAEGGRVTFEDLKSGFDAAYRAGGLYALPLRARDLRDKSRAEAVGRFLDYVKTKNVWIADEGQVASWAGRWLLVDVSGENASKVRSSLIVTNSSPASIESLRVDAYVPGDAGALTASSEKMGGNISVLSRQKGKALLEIRDIRGEGLVFFVEGYGL